MNLCCDIDVRFPHEMSKNTEKPSGASNVDISHRLNEQGFRHANEKYPPENVPDLKDAPSQFNGPPTYGCRTVLGKMKSLVSLSHISMPSHESESTCVFGFSQCIPHFAVAGGWSLHRNSEKFAFNSICKDFLGTVAGFPLEKCWSRRETKCVIKHSGSSPGENYPY